MNKSKSGASRAKRGRPRKTSVTNSVESVQNGLEGALGLGGGFSPFPNQGLAFGGGGFPIGAQVEQVTTIFENLRWYMISNYRQPLSQAYVEMGLVQTICCVPVQDALRGGVGLKSKQLDEDEIEKLQISLDRDNNLYDLGLAAIWNRLYGGSAMITLIGDQDPEEPLDLESINKDTEIEFRPVDMWELFTATQNTTEYDPSLQLENVEFYDYYGQKIHKSRVMRMKGAEAPSFLRPRLRGWGMSEVERLVRSLNQYLKATDLSFEVLDEFKLDVFKFKGLVNTLLMPLGEEKTRRRVQIANANKNYQNAIVLDAEDDFDHKQLSFAGLAETMEGIRVQVAADMRMPMIKLFGVAASGISANDESSIEVYNSMVESQVRNKIKYDILRICEIKCKKLFGFIPDDLSLEFKPLRVLSAEQEENVKTQQFNRVMQAKTAGELSTYEFREAINKGNLLPITLDNAGDMLNPDDPQVADIVSEGLNDPDNSEDTDDEGSGRADTKEPRATDKGGLAKGEIKPGDNNEGIKNVRVYNTIERIDRVINNSKDFDKASYEADGGDAWINPNRLKLIAELTPKNPGLWQKAEDESKQIYGRDNLAFIFWLYSKLGGK